MNRLVVVVVGVAEVEDAVVVVGLGVVDTGVVVVVEEDLAVLVVHTAHEYAEEDEALVVFWAADDDHGPHC